MNRKVSSLTVAFAYHLVAMTSGWEDLLARRKAIEARETL